MEDTVLILARHGESLPLEDKLSFAGKEGLCAMSKELSRSALIPSIYITSSLARAVESAQFVRGQLKQSDETMIVERDFLNIGDFDADRALSFTMRTLRQFDQRAVMLITHWVEKRPENILRKILQTKFGKDIILEKFEYGAHVLKFNDRTFEYSAIITQR